MVSLYASFALTNTATLLSTPITAPWLQTAYSASFFSKEFFEEAFSAATFRDIFLHPENHITWLIILAGSPIAVAAGSAYLAKRIHEKGFKEFMKESKTSCRSCANSTKQTFASCYKKKPASLKIPDLPPDDIPN